VRFINLEGQEPSSSWLEMAKTLSAQLDAAGTKAERNKIIKDNSSVWGNLKPWLLKLSARKCWFSEARDTFSHWDVEHYRPKGTAKNLDGTDQGDGYWWLAFDWHNFRICGNVGNRKKGGFFPLRSGTHQATAADRNIDDEFPYLLDPTRPEDPLLLCFDENGDINPLPDLDPWSKARVDESIKRYKLRDHEALMEARRDVWSKCVREVNRCRNLLEQQATSPSATKKEEIKQQILKLREMIAFQAEFSAVASDCLRSRSEGWAQRLASESVGAAIQ
jgi:uncharacterized protein (TIGR02646 family)